MEPPLNNLTNRVCNKAQKSSGNNIALIVLSVESNH